jgi:hypothetical protein
VTVEEAARLVSAVKQGRTLRVKWEGADACCWLVVRLDASQAFAARVDEIPFDVLSPWRETQVQAWREQHLTDFLAGIRGGTAEITEQAHPPHPRER